MKGISDNGIKIKGFCFLAIALFLCGCSSSTSGFIHNTLQPYYLDCEINSEYEIEDVNIKTYLGLWHSENAYNSLDDKYRDNIKLYVFVNESREILYTDTSCLIKAFDYDEIANENFVFSRSKSCYGYTIIYSYSEYFKIPSNIFQSDSGFMTLAFAFCSNNSVDDSKIISEGGAGIYINYRRTADFKIVLTREQ